jgi:CheY-like chemotaxis protein
VSEVSGRGVGLDVVKRRVESVGGRLRLRTEAGVGTTFALELPTSMVLGAMVCVEVEGARYALSPHEVARVVDGREVGAERAGGGPVVRIDGRPVPLFDLGVLTEQASDSRERPRVLVLRHGERAIAVSVDAFRGTRAVSEQRLDPFLDGLEIVRSVAVLANGELAVVLDTAELIRRADAVLGDAPKRTAAAPSGSSARTSGVRTVLVVDDSELTRDLVVSTLREMGLPVREAVDGAGALAQLEAEEVGLLVTDLDMPVLDGFELIRRVRLSPRARLPIIVLSTRGDDGDVRRALGLGADAYLVKSRLELDHLRRVVRRYVEVTA